MPTGREVLLEVLADEGVRHIFGNPGTTELPLIDELSVRHDFHYVLALQENVAVGMADGYAQASGRPSFVNLHTAGGLGGGLGNLTNALANRTPMVVTAGQQDRRHLVAEPILSGDLVGLARAASKWQHEVRHLGELGTVLRRAFLTAANPPRGPVFVSLPMDVLDEAGDVAVPVRTAIDRGSVAGGLEELAGLLTGAAPGRLALVAGDGVAAADAVAEMTELAEVLGAKVFSPPLYSNLDFPTTHPLWCGMLGMTATGAASMLGAFDRVFVVGGKALLAYHWTPGSPVPPGTELLHLADDAGEVGRDVPARWGATGDVRATLRALLPLVRAGADGASAAAAAQKSATEKAAAEARWQEVVAGRSGDVPLHATAAVAAVLAGAPPSSVVVDESITASLHLRAQLRRDAPGSYFFARGGGLGWGLPAALGIQLARPGAPVLCVIGDGSAMYAVQALWTAAHERLPVVVAVLNNRQYAILKGNLAGGATRSAQSGRFVGLDLDDPPIDYVALAGALGVDAVRVEKFPEVSEAVASAFASGRPGLVEVPVLPGQLTP